MAPLDMVSLSFIIYILTMEDQTAKHKPFDSEYYGTKIKKLLDMSLSNLTSQSAQQTPVSKP